MRKTHCDVNAKNAIDRKFFGRHVTRLLRNAFSLGLGAQMNRNTLLIVAGTLLLNGCAADIYDKPGATQAEFGVDQGQCQMFAMGVPQAQAPYVPPTYNSYTNYNGSYGYGQVSGTATTTTYADDSGQAMANLGTAIGNAARQRNAMRACMASKGYVRRQN